MNQVRRTGSKTKWLTAVVLVLGICLLTGAAVAGPGVHFEELFEATSGEGLLAGYRGYGWGLAPVDEADSIPGYLNYPAQEFFDRESGGVEFVLQRDDRGENPGTLQTVLCVVGSDGIPGLRFYISWMTTRPGETTVYLNGLDTFLPVHPNAAIHLGRVVQNREWAHFLLSWDRREGFVRLYVNGEPAGEWLSDPEILEEQFAGPGNGSVRNVHRQVVMPSRLYHLVVGAVPSAENPFLGSSPLVGSVVDNIRIHQDAVDPGNIIHVDSVTHNGFRSAGYSGKLVAGDELTVVLKGDPYQLAWCDIGKTKDIPMAEDTEQPGTYYGTHTVTYEDGVFEGPVIGRLTSDLGLSSSPALSHRDVQIDSRISIQVESSKDLIPADVNTVSELSIAASDANGKPVRDRELKVTLSTTDDYTGLEGGGVFRDLVGGKLDVKWGGVTDAFGEVTAQYVSGFAAKTVLISARDMVSGNVGVGYVRSFIEGSVDVVVTEPEVKALSIAGSMDISLSREWLTADGRSRSRITAEISGPDNDPASGHNVTFTLLGSNGSIRIVQGKTDSRGRAFADYIAGTVMGQVLVEVRDTTSGMVELVAIELRPDAPAEIVLMAEPGEIATGEETVVTARVSDANGNPNSNVDVLYDLTVGEGKLNSASVATDDKGIASVVFLAGGSSGVVTVRGTVTSRSPTPEEMDAAAGAVFLYGLSENPGHLEVRKWYVEPGEDVVEDQELLTLEDRAGGIYTVVAPRDGIMSVFTAEERDSVEYGDTLGYVLQVSE